MNNKKLHPLDMALECSINGFADMGEDILRNQPQMICEFCLI